MAGQLKIASMGCGGKCLKYTLATINIIFFIVGLILAAFAGYAAFNKQSKIHRLLAQYQLPALNDGLYILFAVGLILAFISFIGMWGTIAENTCLLFTYFLIIFIILVLQLAGIIVCFVEFKKIEKKLIHDMGKKAPPQSDTSALIEATVIAASIGAFEKEFHCCGITGPKDYGSNPIPPTCYAPLPAASRSKRSGSDDEEATPGDDNVADEATATTAPHGALYQKGCGQVARPYLYAAGGIAIGIMLLQLFVLIFTCCLMSSIKDQYQPV